MYVENSMLRRCILLLIITATLPVLGITEEINYGWTPFSLSFPGYNGKMSRVYGLDFGIIGLDPQQEVTGIGLDPIYSLNKKITGLAIAGAAVNSDKLSIDTNINGLAIGGGLVRSDASINGFAISGQMVEADDINGVAIGGGALSIAVGIVSFGLLPPVDLFGVSARNSLHGVGISAISMNVNNHLNGLAVSAATIEVKDGNINGMPISPGIKSKNTNGFDICLVMITEEEMHALDIHGIYGQCRILTGVQIGLVNNAREINKGVQIGLLNFSKNGILSLFPIINFNFRRAESQLRIKNL